VPLRFGCDRSLLRQPRTQRSAGKSSAARGRFEECQFEEARARKYLALASATTHQPQRPQPVEAPVEAPAPLADADAASLTGDSCSAIASSMASASSAVVPGPSDATAPLPNPPPPLVTARAARNRSDCEIELLDELLRADPHVIVHDGALLPISQLSRAKRPCAGAGAGGVAVGQQHVVQLGRRTLVVDGVLGEVSREGWVLQGVMAAMVRRW